MKSRTVFNTEQKRQILKICLKKKDETDMQIAKTLIGQNLFSKYITNPDTLRRYITFARDWFNLRPIVLKKEIKQKIEEIYKTYGSLSGVQVASKLKFYFKNLSLKTLQGYVLNYKNYGDF